MRRVLTTRGRAWDGERLRAGPVTVVLAGGHIEAVGFGGEVPAAAAGAPGHDLGDSLLTPGLVDAHTHLLFAGDRSFEADLHRQGKSYLEIMEAGGGIHATVAATRAASDATLLTLARARLAAMRAAGTTLVEAKTGYGLARGEELRHLALYKTLSQEGPQRLVPTLLMAHAVPPGEDPEDFMQSVEATAVAAWEGGLAERFDVFLEKGAFALEDAARLLWAARSLGYALTLHAGQFNDLGGAELAARVGAASLDHGEVLGPGDPATLAGGGVAVGLLPACNLHLSTGTQPNARRLLDADVALFLATDLNAGSSPATSLLEVAGLAFAELGMTHVEILRALTSAPADALGRHLAGRIAPGAWADLAAWAGDESLFGLARDAAPTALYIAGEPVTM